MKSCSIAKPRDKSLAVCMLLRIEWYMKSNCCVWDPSFLCGRFVKVNMSEFLFIKLNKCAHMMNEHILKNQMFNCQQGFWILHGSSRLWPYTYVVGPHSPFNTSIVMPVHVNETCKRVQVTGYSVMCVIFHLSLQNLKSQRSSGFIDYCVRNNHSL